MYQKGTNNLPYGCARTWDLEGCGNSKLPNPREGNVHLPEALGFEGNTQSKLLVRERVENEIGVLLVENLSRWKIFDEGVT